MGAIGQERSPASKTLAGSQAPCGVVLVHVPDAQAFARAHERDTRTAIARKLAVLKGYSFAGEHEPQRRYGGPIYLVPSDTLVGLEEARALGVGGEHDLFGGVVPHAFVATKVITHPLLNAPTRAPAGWAHGFKDRVGDAVLPGFSVFTGEDALRAGRQLLAHGPVRLKPVHATGGRGQFVVADEAELEAAIGALHAGDLARDGLVLEENLVEVTTHT
jgi:Protein of unknown function (DUF3182)